MKYSIFLKFIAVILCAASLLGIVGSGIGILCMIQGDLYDQTVEEMLEERILLDNESRAYTVAVRYASETLGGAPEDLIYRRYSQYHGGVLNGLGGYAILDENGEVLTSVNPEYKDTMRTHSFPITGQYIHLVSRMTEEEKYPSYTQPEAVNGVAVDTGEVYIYDAMPETPVAVHGLMFTFADGGYYEYQTGSIMGFAYKDQQGKLICVLEDHYAELEPSRTVTQIILLDRNDTLLYEARSENGVGYFDYGDESGSQTFQSTLSAALVREAEVPGSTLVTATAPASIEETVAVTTPETVPATTPATVAETVSETVAVTELTEPPAETTAAMELEMNIPLGEAVEVQKIQVLFASGGEAVHEDPYGIGRIRQEGGEIQFTSYEHWDFDTGPVKWIHFLGAEEEPVFCVHYAEDAGEVFLDENARIAYRMTVSVPEPAETVPPETVEETVPLTEAVTVPVTVPETVPETVAETFPEAAVSAAQPVLIAGKPLEEYDIQTERYWDYDLNESAYIDYVYVTMPKYTVEMYWDENSISNPEMYQVLDIVRENRQYLLPLLGISILLLVITGVYLCAAAGHKPKSEEIRAGGLNRIPLDLYLGIVGLGVPGLCVLVIEGGGYFLRKELLVGCAFGAGMAYCACLLAVGFLFALVAQIKTAGGFWWRNTLCGHCVRLFYRFVIWLEGKATDKCFPALGRAIKKLWNWAVQFLRWVFRAAEKSLVWLYRFTDRSFRWIGHKIGMVFAWLGRTIHRFLTLLPLTWQWLLTGFMMFLMIGIVFATNGEELLMVLSLGICIGLIVYGAHCFGSLLDSTKKMSEGDLDAKVDDKLMVGAFQNFADALNALAGVAVTAAQKQLKSERMKTELITNVSHDIKTPLTSIINYVDLLRKPHTPEQEEQYMEVLDRQSQRLKKLVEDLMDMSKASTGNMSVEITKLDAVESINQALGEFADKLEKARITPVFRHTEVEIPIMADGRLVWRVLSNLLGNAVKYAMPGTRLYLDLMQVEEMVILSIKNISRDELNIDAEELMERFVRGDDSRNTEGSGLGLNIAKSLMELQKGQMQLLVDGDLFKVTLNFPKA